jgi:hypothetical protein
MMRWSASTGADPNPADTGKLLSAIKSAKNNDDLESIYGSKQFQRALERLVKSQERAHTNEEKETWAMTWAFALGGKESDSQEYKNALALDGDRRVCFELLKRLVDLHWDKRGDVLVDPTVSKDNLKEFDHRIKRILALCLPMDRAQALYTMQKEGQHPPGMNWYAAEHESDGNYNTDGFRDWNDPTLSRKYMHLRNMKELGIQEDEWLERLLTPHARVGTVRNRVDP